MGSALKDNADTACYFVIKHSWKGKYVLCLLHDCHWFSRAILLLTGSPCFAIKNFWKPWNQMWSFCIEFVSFHTDGSTDMSNCRYRRIFSVGTRGITTYNPSDREITNQVRRHFMQLCVVLSFRCSLWVSSRAIDLHLSCLLQCVWLIGYAYRF